MAYEEVNYNSVILKITSMTPVKTQKTVKQIIGKKLTEIKVLGLDDQQWNINLNGFITGTTSANLDTNRSAVEALDSVTAYDYVDGLHNGTYILVPGSLSFNDVGGEVQSMHKYSMKLVEK